MAIYTVHAGHAKQGEKYSGAAGYCYESVENRKIKDAVIRYLREEGNTVYDCTVDSGRSQSAIITEIKRKINSHKNAAANISIHLNSYIKGPSDGKTKGVEALVYYNTGASNLMAVRICQKVADLGFTNRGVKVRKNLGVLKGITNGGINIIVETFFCDDEDDYKQYINVGENAIGKAIAEGILNKNIANENNNSKDNNNSNENNSNSQSNAAAIERKVIISAGQLHANNFAGTNLTADGIRGPRTVTAGKEVLQAALNLDYNAKLAQDGIIGEKTLRALGNHYVRRGERQYMVTAAEILLMLKGYNPQGVESPGQFGEGLELAVKQYQADNNLAVTGIVDINMFLSLIA